MSSDLLAATAGADPDRLAASLSAATGSPVERCETHMSTVLLTRDRAYKLKKPVAFDFADQRDAAARATAYAHELALNAALAPGVGLAVRAVLPSGDGYVLGPERAAGAIDHVVEMRRFDERRTMRALLERDALSADDARRVGARIARFHLTAEHAPAPDVRALVHRNLEALVPLAAGLVPPADLLALERFAGAFLLTYDDVLAARARRGRVVDGHGDLRAEHIVLEDDAVLVVDRLEWDGLRYVDVADDLAFLLMDLEHLGGGWALPALLDGYAAAGGSQPPAALIAFYGAYRAAVRAKVALLRARQPSERPPGADTAEAVRLLRLARRFAWRARGPLRLLVTGPPASGKSTLAAALGAASGLPVVSSDALRGEADYSDASRAEVYHRLGSLAAKEPSAIVDATFGDPALHRAFLEGLGRTSGLLAIECVAPEELRVARAQAREAAGGSSSAAGPDVTRRLGRRFVAVQALAGSARLAVDTQAPVEIQVDEVEGWLDVRLVRGAGL